MATDDLVIRASARDELSRPVRGMAREVDNLESRTRRAGRGMERGGRSAGRMSRGLATLQRGARRLDRALARGVRTLGRFARGLGRRLRRAALLGGAAIAGFAGLAIKSFADFDQAMTQSLAIMGDVSDGTRKEMEDVARTVATSTKFAADEAAEAYYFLASAGMDAAQSMEALPVVAQFAQAGAFDLARATDLLTDAQTALGMAMDDPIENLEEMTRLGDVVAQANNIANASMEQYSEALTNKAGAALRTYNKDVEEGVAVLAAYADAGVKGAAAGEGLNIMLRDVTRAAEGNSGEWKKLGIEVFDTEGNLKNMADVVEELEGGLEGMSDGQKAATMDALGLTRGVGDQIRLLSGSSDAIREYEEELRNAGGTMEEVADKQAESLKFQWGILTSRTKDLFLELGMRLGPALGGIVGGINAIIPSAKDLEGGFDRLEARAEHLGDRARGLADLMPELREGFDDAGGGADGLRAILADLTDDNDTLLAVFDEARGILTDVATVFRDLLIPVISDASAALPLFLSPLRMARALLGFIADNAETLAPILSGLLAGFLAFRGVVLLVQAWTAAQWLLNAALAANPIGIVIALIAGLVAGLVYAYNNSETFRNAVQRVADLFRGAFQSAADGARSIIERIGDVIETVADWFRRTKERVGDAIAALGNIKGPEPLRRIAELAERAGEALGRAGERARELGSGAADRVRGWASNIPGVGDTATSMLSRTGGAGGGLASTMAQHGMLSAGGIRVTNALAGTGGSGDHEAGRALDLQGSGLGGYKRRLEDAGGWGEYHGSGAGRHLHAVYPSEPMLERPGPSSSPSSGGGTATAARPVNVHVHPSPGMDEQALANAVIARIRLEERRLAERRNRRP